MITKSGIAGNIDLSFSAVSYLGCFPFVSTDRPAQSHRNDGLAMVRPASSDLESALRLSSHYTS